LAKKNTLNHTISIIQYCQSLH